ncbi:MAG TPA: C40 family peptidase [Acidimicrobiales bacterium]|nr:C40 family peptidase [Acidimicrobiales bacterium]
MWHMGANGGDGRRSGRAATRAVVVAALAAGVAFGPSVAAAPATPPPTSVAPAAATTPLPTVTVPGAPSPVAVPPIPPVDPQYTDGQDPNVLLERAIELSSVGASQAPLQASLDAAQQTLDASSVEAQQAQTAADAARAAADAAGAAATEDDREAADLQAALREAALNLYTGGSDRQALAWSVRDVDQLSAAAAYEDTVLSPDGILAERKAVARAADAQLRRRQGDLQAAEAASARAATAVAAAAAATDHIKQELTALTSQAALLVADEHTALSTQAAKALTSPSALEFTPSVPLPAPLATTSVALAWAFSELGKPYLWGGTGPDMFDCSGLMQYSWGKAGVQIPRTSEEQYTAVAPVPLSQLLPGDLVFFGTTDIHHVGMYIGDGLMVNAPHTGTVVQIEPIWWTDLNGFGRVVDGATPVPARPGPQAGAVIEPAVVQTAGTVPSETAPPPGYVAPPGASGAPVDTTSTTAPPAGSGTTSAPPSTTAPTTAPTSTLVPGVTEPPAPSSTATTTTTTTTTAPPQTVAPASQPLVTGPLTLP